MSLARTDETMPAPPAAPAVTRPYVHYPDCDGEPMSDNTGCPCPFGPPGWMKPGAGAPAGARRIGGTREGRRIHSGDRAARGQEPEGVS
jgi:hypothetical protein